MFDAHKHGASVVLTDAIPEDFGVAFIPPALAHLIGFGLHGVKMHFDVKLDATCTNTKFVIHYGGKRACLFKREHLSEKEKVDNERIHAQVKKYEGPPGRWVVVPTPLNAPCFDLKPIPWPKNPDYALDKLEKPVRPDFVNPQPDADFEEEDCDGISMALIGGGSAPGIYLAKEDMLLHHSDTKSFVHKERVEVSLEYYTNGVDHFMNFLIDKVPLMREPIEFKTAELSEGSRWAPKISIMAATSSTECPASHSISKVYFEMDEVLVGSQCEWFKEMVCKEKPEEEEAMFLLNSELASFVEKPSETLTQEKDLSMPAQVAGAGALLTLMAIFAVYVRNKTVTNYVPL
jgi:hypothetical protein